MTEAEKLRRLIATKLDKAATSLRAARVLFDDELYDDSTSRSYYAMFHAASALLLTKGQSSSKHKGVISMFDRHFVKTGILPRDMSAALHNAFKARQVADYSGEALNPESEAESTLARASEFLDRAREFLRNEGVSKSPPIS